MSPPRLVYIPAGTIVRKLHGGTVLVSLGSPLGSRLKASVGGRAHPPKGDLPWEDSIWIAEGVISPKGTKKR